MKLKEYMIVKGLRFGFLLQLAIGPICLYIFNIAMVNGFINGMVGVFGVVLIDALYIALSIVGITAIVKKNEKLLKIFGSIILVAFGMVTIFHAFDIKETIDISVSRTYFEAFTKAVVLTGANPLTIIFWSGVFSSKIIEDNYKRNDQVLFGVGAVLSTLIFLTGIALAGQFTSRFISNQGITVLNVIVGMMLIYFGVKLMVIKKNKF